MGDVGAAAGKIKCFSDRSQSRPKREREGPNRLGGIQIAPRLILLLLLLLRRRRRRSKDDARFVVWGAILWPQLRTASYNVTLQSLQTQDSSLVNFRTVFLDICKLHGD